jgi:predicted regulator of Ras-like GTPase activity (Roadblock/LC7/MglB family)
MTGAGTWSLGEGDAQRITEHLIELLRESSARCALLTAADFSANDQLAKMIGESEFASLFHQGEKESMYLADVGRRVILVVLFDERTTVGLVRLRVKHAVHDLATLFDELFSRWASGTPEQRRPLLEGAEDEIDRLFGD